MQKWLLKQRLHPHLEMLPSLILQYLPCRLPSIKYRFASYIFAKVDNQKYHQVIFFFACSFVFYLLFACFCFKISLRPAKDSNCSGKWLLDPLGRIQQLFATELSPTAMLPACNRFGSDFIKHKMAPWLSQSQTQFADYKHSRCKLTFCLCLLYYNGYSFCCDLKYFITPCFTRERNSFCILLPTERMFYTSLVFRNTSIN